nr:MULTISPECIES: hypothetical protein [unclassified Mesorhizobium]
MPINHSLDGLDLYSERPLWLVRDDPRIRRYRAEHQE